MKNKLVMISATIKLMSKSEILKHVPDEVYQKIKAQDANPMFAMMSIGHEGTATGELYAGEPGGEKKLSQWYKQLWPLKAVKELVSKMKSASFLPIYEAHAQDLNTGRTVVGNIVAATRKLIKGVSHAVGIAYINNYGTREKIKSGELDGCSLEAECIFQESDNLFRFIVQKVKSLTGIALLNSEENPPAFKDANILAVVTAMAKKNTEEEEEEEDTNDKDKHKQKKASEKGKGKPMTLEEIKKWLKDQGMNASNVFSIEELTSVPSVIDAFKNEHEGVVTEKDKKITELSEELAPFKTQASRDKTTELIKKSDLLANEYENVVSFISKTLVVDLDGVEDKQVAVDKAIKSQLAIMKEADFKTKTSETNKEDEEKEDKTNPTKKAEERQRNDSEKDYTDPADNELIPQAAGTGTNKKE